MSHTVQWPTQAKTSQAWDVLTLARYMDFLVPRPQPRETFQPSTIYLSTWNTLFFFVAKIALLPPTPSDTSGRNAYRTYVRHWCQASVRYRRRCKGTLYVHRLGRSITTHVCKVFTRAHTIIAFFGFGEQAQTCRVLEEWPRPIPPWAQERCAVIR